MIPVLFGVVPTKVGHFGLTHQQKVMSGNDRNKESDMIQSLINSFQRMTSEGLMQSAEASSNNLFIKDEPGSMLSTCQSNTCKFTHSLKMSLKHWQFQRPSLDVSRVTLSVFFSAHFSLYQEPKTNISRLTPLSPDLPAFIWSSISNHCSLSASTFINPITSSLHHHFISPL